MKGEIMKEKLKKLKRLLNKDVLWFIAAYALVAYIVLVFCGHGTGVEWLENRYESMTSGVYLLLIFHMLTNIVEYKRKLKSSKSNDVKITMNLPVIKTESDAKSFVDALSEYYRVKR